MEEYITQDGAFPSPKDIRDYKLLRDEDISISEYIISNIHVKNQGKKPTCAAHVLSEIVEYNYQKELGEYERFSTDFIYGLRDNTTYKDEGMYLRDGLRIIKDFGDVFYDYLSSNSYADGAAAKVSQDENKLKVAAEPYRITSYYKINSIEDLKYSILHNGPVAGSMRWYDGSKLVNGIFQFDSTKNYYGHAVLLVGWNKEGFIVQNSWGKTWGKKGLFIILYKDISTLFFELYGVTDNILSVKKPNKTTNFIAPLINLLLFTITQIFNKLKN